MSFQCHYPKTPPVPSTEYDSSLLPNDVTVVTAYFNLGTFIKGEVEARSKETYMDWMSNFAFLNNMVVLFTDIKEIKEMFTEKRQHLHSNFTKVILINRDDWWSFNQSAEIRRIYHQPGYPQFHPNTVDEYYSCAMHAKYDALKYVIDRRMYHTKYVAWVDIGYFREKEKQTFKILPPRDFKTGHIGFSQINPFYNLLTPRDVIFGNRVWIGGGFFVGQPEYLILFIEDYQHAIKLLLSKGLMSTDQQVLYIMYLSAHEFKPRVPLQLFYYTYWSNWFTLGYVCREVYDNQRRSHEKLVKRSFRYM